MKNFSKNWPTIKKRLGRAECIFFMLDFDGTLAAIAKTPGQAFLPSKTKHTLKKLSRLWPTAVISGRSLADIKKKVGLKNLIYAGNHGLEWEMNGRRYVAPKIDNAVKLLSSLAPRIQNLLKHYPGTLLENKTLSFSVHYRRLSPARSRRFKKDFSLKIKPLLDKQLQIFEGKKIFEIRPRTSWNKGRCALQLLHNLQARCKHRIMPVYIGDDTTDEDAFRDLRTGLTVRVGQNRGSAAQYWINGQKNITSALDKMLRTKNTVI